MFSSIGRFKRSRKGSTMVEAALVVPLVFLLCVGAADFARLFYHALTVKGASGGAALYGAQELIRSGDITGMQARAEQDASNLPGVSAVPTQVCMCPGATAFPCIDYSTTVCTGYGKARAYVRVQVNQDFETIGRYWSVPHQTNIRETSWMRVQ